MTGTIPDVFWPIRRSVLTTNRLRTTIWKIRRKIVIEIIFLTKGVSVNSAGEIEQDKTKAITQSDAIAQVANSNNMSFDTVERNYKEKKYRGLKDQIGVYF